MVAVHSTVGTLVILAYLVTAVVSFSGWGSPKVGRIVSGIASVLLLAQILIGFYLLGEGNRNVVLHYLLAFVALVSVGIEHAVARPRGQRAAGFAAVATLVIVLLTYLVGQGTIG